MHTFTHCLGLRTDCDMFRLQLRLRLGLGAFPAATCDACSVRDAAQPLVEISRRNQSSLVMVTKAGCIRRGLFSGTANQQPGQQWIGL